MKFKRILLLENQVMIMLWHSFGELIVLFVRYSEFCSIIVIFLSNYTIQGLFSRLCLFMLLACCMSPCFMSQGIYFDVWQWYTCCLGCTVLILFPSALRTISK